MTITYKPEEPFFGRMYTKGFSDFKPCYVEGRNLQTLSMTLPLNGTVCGINEAISMQPWNRFSK